MLKRIWLEQYEKMDSLKKAIFLNFLLSMVGYHIAILISFICVLLDANFYSAMPFTLLLLTIYLVNTVFIWYYLKPIEISREFKNKMQGIQILIWSTFFCVWVFLMPDQRVLTLLCAMMVMTFLFAYATFYFSLFLIFCISTVYFLIGYIGYKFFNHHWDMQQDILNTMTFILTSSLMGYMVYRKTLVLRKQAQNDFLTRLLNRRSMSLHIKQEYQRCVRFKRSASLVMIDLDDFKFINDEYGHACGDTVLVHVANIMKKQLRKTDYLARWGGEEFLVLLAGSNTTEAQNVIERALSILRSEPVIYNQHKINISFSAGVSKLDNCSSPEQAIQDADKMLYISKEKGKGCVNINEQTLSS